MVCSEQILPTTNLYLISYLIITVDENSCVQQSCLKQISGLLPGVLLGVLLSCVHFVTLITGCIIRCYNLATIWHGMFDFWYFRSCGMSQICYRTWNGSAHGWWNWFPTFHPSTWPPSRHRGRSCDFPIILISPSRDNFQLQLFPRKTIPLGPAVDLLAYREPGMHNLVVYPYQISTLSNFSRVCSRLVSTSSTTQLHPQESPQASS